MRQAIKFPMMASASHKGKDVIIAASRHVEFDIPEISEAETTVAMGEVEQENAGRRFRVLPALRFHEGRLFRRIADSADEIRLRVGLDCLAFPSSRKSDFVLGDNPHYASTNNSPVGNPIWSILFDRLRSMSMDVHNKQNRTMPPLRYHDYIEHWEAVVFDEIATTVNNISDTDLDECFRMHAHQCQRLLMIEGRLWYETKPPCVAVETRWQDGKPSRSAPRISLRYLPDYPDSTLTTVFYPLHEAALAEEFASTRRYADGMERPVSFLPDYEVDEAHPAFDFDSSAHLVDRAGHALAMALLKTAVDRPDRLPDADMPLLATTREKFNASNGLLNVDDSWGEEIEAIWELFERVKPFRPGELGSFSLEELRRLMPDVIARKDSARISLFDVGAPAFR